MAGGDNCHLGERAFHTLDFYTDVLPDREYDVYIRNEKGPPVCVPRRSTESDCFERVRSGLKLHNSMTKSNMMTHSISDCEKACISSNMFTCRGFSYRYGSPTIGHERENCQLTDFPIADLNPAKHFVEDPSCELYHRGSYGHGCELDKWSYNQPPPPQQPPAMYGPPSASGSSYFVPPPKNGYRPPPPPPSSAPPNYNNGYNYGSGYKPSGNYPYKPHGYLPPNGGYSPPSSYDPSGSGVHNSGNGGHYSGNGGYGFPEYPAYNPPPTNSIQPSYLPPSYQPPLHQPPPPPQPPAQTSYLPPSGPDPTQSTGNNMYLPPSSSGGGTSYPGSASGGGSGYGSTSFGATGNDVGAKDRMCYMGYGSPARLTPSAVRNSLMAQNELECKAQCSQARETSHFRCASLSYRGNNCELSDIEQRDLRPGVDFSHEAGYWLFSWDFTDARCYTPPKGSVPPPSGPNAMNTAGGMEGTWQKFTVSGQPCKAGTMCTQNKDVGVWSCPVEGLDGDWDYCCRAGHQCGYSEGFNYPWCYVGAEKEQWRPCSEHYYPYPHSNRPQHWPVAYLHREGPPNMTIEHQPSIVDNFLETLRHESHGKEASTVVPVADFQPVDLSDPREDPRKDAKTDESAMNKLWMWGQSKFNLTESGETTESSTALALSTDFTTTTTTSVTDDVISTTPAITTTT